MSRKSAQKRQQSKDKAISQTKAGSLPASALSSIKDMVEQALPAAVNRVLADPTPQASTPAPAVAPKARPAPRPTLVAPQGKAPTRRASEFENIVRNAATEKVISLSQLSRLLGRSNGYLTSVFAGHSPISQELIRNCAGILGTTAFDTLLSPQSKAKLVDEPQAPAIPLSPVLLDAISKEDSEPSLGVPATVGVASQLQQSTDTSVPGLTIKEIIAAAAKPVAVPTVRMTITPAIAKKFLQHNKTNRTISTSHVQWFAKQISDNEWDSENGEAIKFSPEGNLLDGQHRLMGIVLANIDVECDVQFGVPQTSQATMDVGRKRSIGDQLSISGEKYGNQVASTIRWIYAISNGTIAYKTSTPEVKRFLERYPAVADAVSHVKSQKFTGTNPTLLCALYFIAKEALGEGEKAAAFVKVFTTGYPSYEGDPAHRVREVYIEARTKGSTITSARQAANLIHAWNLFRKGASVKSIRLPQEIRIDGFDPASLGVSTEARIPAQTVKLDDGTAVLERA